MQLWRLEPLVRQQHEAHQLWGPKLDDAVAWLQSPAVLKDDGPVLSWSNVDHPGYPYPEAAGLWLAAYPWFLSWGTPDALPALNQRADRVAQWLCEELSPVGGVGRDGYDYVFDTAVGLAGLLRYSQARQPAGTVASRVNDAITASYGFVQRALQDRVAMSPEASSDRWSQRFGSHQLKCTLALELYANRMGSIPENPASLTELANGISSVITESDPVYVHGLCYALEGLAVRTMHRNGSQDSRIFSLLEQLVAMQDPTGGIAAFIHEGRGLGPCRSDATAQLIRLWCLVDPNRYQGPIRSALQFLKDMQAPCGGIRYEPGSNDINTWSTLFTVQAVDAYVRGGLRPLELL